MKQCISRVIQYFTHLWQTLKEYVCKRTTKYPKISIDNSDHTLTVDVDRDGSNEFEWHYSQNVPIIHNEDIAKQKEENVDGNFKSDCLETSTRDGTCKPSK